VPYGEGEGVHRVLLGKPEGKRPLGRPRRRWEDNLRWIFMKWEGGVPYGDGDKGSPGFGGEA
jgi:hypothetical protein